MRKGASKDETNGSNGGDYANYPKDADNPYSEDRGYMSLRPISSFSITIPSEWPDASEVTNE